MTESESVPSCLQHNIQCLFHYINAIYCVFLSLVNFSPKEVASEFRTLLLQISVALKKAVFLSGIQYLPYFTSIITLYRTRAFFQRRNRTRAFFRAIPCAYQFMHCRIQQQKKSTENRMHCRFSHIPFNFKSDHFHSLKNLMPDLLPWHQIFFLTISLRNQSSLSNSSDNSFIQPISLFSRHDSSFKKFVEGISLSSDESPLRLSFSNK